MPKNKGKGGKNRRRGKNENESAKREIILKEDGQEYALVTALLGNGKLALKFFDDTRRIGHIRGKLRKKVWISVNDVILVSLREYQDDRCDVILKYNADEVRYLKNSGVISDISEDQKNEVIKFSMEGKDNVDSGDEDILANLLGTKNLNRPTQEMLASMSDESSEEESSEDDDEEDDDEEEESDEEESEEEESNKKPNYKTKKVEKTQQQLEIERILSGMDIGGVTANQEKDYSINKVKTKISTFSDMVDKNDESEKDEEKALSNADLMSKINLFQSSIKSTRINKSSTKK